MRKYLILFISFLLVLPFSAHALQFSEITQTASNVVVEGQVRATFATTPVMIAIAQCESGFRQFDSSGKVLRGGNGTVLGVFQLSEGHTQAALGLGYDIQTVDGNISYAKYLFEKQGTTPWMAAFPCWHAADTSGLSSAANSSDSSVPTNSTTSTSSSESQASPVRTTGTSSLSAQPLLISDLSFGMDTEEVKVLQQILNANGFLVASSGLGSKGNEITSFGSLTRAAVRKFQCAKAIVCNGDEHTTGFGLVNESTRTVLLAGLPQGAVSILPSPPTALPPTAGLTRELEYGMEGEDIKLLQTFLKKQGLFTVGVNGVFGPATRAAVIKFQKKYNLSPAFGYVGPKTLATIAKLGSL